MSRSLATTTAAYALGVAGWIALRSLRGRGRMEAQGAAFVVLQAALLLQGLLAGVAWLRDEGPAEPPVFGGYLALSLLLLPGGWLACRRDASPWSTARLAVAAAGVAVVSVRMNATWSTGGA